MEESINPSYLYWVHREKPDDSTSIANMKPDSMLWASQELHLFIITDAGKPIYSRYGTVQTLSPILCTCVIILEHMKTLNESLNHFTAGNHTFVFLPKKPFIFIAVSKSSLPATFLFKQLNFLYSLFLSLFSEKFIRTIAETHSCDFRQYAEGTRSAWDGVVNNMSQDPAFIFAPSIPVTFMQPELRQKLIHSTPFDRLPSCKLVMLMHRNRVLAIGPCNCDALSLRLIVDLMWTPAFQNEESWAVFFVRNSSEQMHHLYFKNHESSDYRIVMLCSDNKGFSAYHNFAVSMFKDLEKNYFEEMSKPLVGAPDVFYFWTVNSITYGQVYVTDPSEKVFGFSSEIDEKFQFTSSNEEIKEQSSTEETKPTNLPENETKNEPQTQPQPTENNENENQKQNENSNGNENAPESESEKRSDDKSDSIKSNDESFKEIRLNEITNKSNDDNDDDADDNNDTKNKPPDDSKNESNTNSNEFNGEDNYINKVFNSSNSNENVESLLSNDNNNNNNDNRSESYEKMQNLYRQLAKCYEMVQTNGVDGEYMFRGDKDVIVVYKSKDMEIYAVAKSDELKDQKVTEKLNELKTFVNNNINKLIMTERKFHVDKFG